MPEVENPVKNKIFIIIVFGSLILYGCYSGLLVNGGRAEKKTMKSYYASYNPEAMNHFMNGMFYYYNGNFPMAVIEFLDALEADSSSPTMYLALARTYFNMGKVENGIRYVKRVIRIDPENIEANEIMGKFYELSGDLNRAEKYYKKLVSLQPDDIHSLYLLGNVYLNKRDLRKALSIFERIISIDSTQMEALEKVAQLTFIDSMFDKSLQYFTQLSRLDPANSRYKQAIADILFFKKDYDSSIAVYKTMIDEDPEDIKLKMKFAEILANVDDDSYKEYFINYMNRLLKEHGDRKELYLIYSSYLRRNKKFQECIAILDSALSKFPNGVELYIEKGIVYRNLKNYQAEEAVYLKAMQIDSNNIALRHQLAIVWDQLKKYTKSDSLYEIILTENPNDHLALNNYAYSLAVRSAKLDKAYKMVERALQLNPGNPSYLDTKGWILYQEGRYKDALKYILQAYNKAKDNVEVLEHLGDLYIKLNKKKKAFEYYKKALTIDPEYEGVRKKLQQFD